MTTEFPRNLRYSPVNYLIVDWGFNGNAFNNCGLPQPQPCEEATNGDAPAVCTPLPIQEAIDTKGWGDWMSEVIVGVEEPNEEIAASYVREAAIRFAKYTRVLQRQILIPLQQGVCSYPVEPYEGEQIIGVLGAGTDELPACECNGCSGFLPVGVRFVLDTARNIIHLEGQPGMGCCGDSKVLRLLVWAAPSEDACFHDRFLYDRFREDITSGARRNYVSSVHFRDRALVSSLRLLPDFSERMILAKGKALSRPSSQPRSSMWDGAIGPRGQF